MRYSISAFLNVVGILSCFIRVHISSACVGGEGATDFSKWRPILYAPTIAKSRSCCACVHVHVHVCVSTCRLTLTCSSCDIVQ